MRNQRRELRDCERLRARQLPRACKRRAQRLRKERLGKMRREQHRSRCEATHAQGVGCTRKFACYMWEGYRRHTGLESHTVCFELIDSVRPALTQRRALQQEHYSTRTVDATREYSQQGWCGVCLCGLGKGWLRGKFASTLCVRPGLTYPKERVLLSTTVRTLRMPRVKTRNQRV
jgi:hypothetical protein